MMLEGTNTSAAIRWVREDLDECLEAVRENLEAFSEDMSRREPLVAVDKNWPKIMSILYRPIPKKKGDKYQIQSYR